MIRAPQMRAARQRFRQMAPVLNEQSLRRYVAMEAGALGHGGVSAMARVSGLARSTIYHGLSDIRCNITAPTGRIRRPGGGRKRKVLQYPKLLADLKRLVAPSTRGDPGKPLCGPRAACVIWPGSWQGRGIGSVPACWRALRGLGYSLQANSKTKEGGQHIDRDAQFRYINAQAEAFLATQEPSSRSIRKRRIGGQFQERRPGMAP